MLLKLTIQSLANPLMPPQDLHITTRNITTPLQARAPPSTPTKMKPRGTSSVLRTHTHNPAILAHLLYIVNHFQALATPLPPHPYTLLTAPISFQIPQTPQTLQIIQMLMRIPLRHLPMIQMSPSSPSVYSASGKGKRRIRTKKCREIFVNLE